MTKTTNYSWPFFTSRLNCKSPQQQERRCSSGPCGVVYYLATRRDTHRLAGAMCTLPTTDQLPRVAARATPSRSSASAAVGYVTDLASSAARPTAASHLDWRRAPLQHHAALEVRRVPAWRPNAAKSLTLSGLWLRCHGLPAGSETRVLPLLPSAEGSPEPSDSPRGARGAQFWPLRDGHFVGSKAASMVKAAVSEGPKLGTTGSYKVTTLTMLVADGVMCPRTWRGEGEGSCGAGLFMGHNACVMRAYPGAR